MKRGFYYEHEPEKNPELPFAVYDDEYVYTRVATLEKAKEEIDNLRVEIALADAVSDAVDEMLDNLKAEFPKVGEGKLKQLIVENLT